VLKGIRWLLVKNPENLRPNEDRDKDERKRLQDALAINEPLMLAYYLKEDLRQFWDQRDQAAAEQFLDGWLARAESSGVTMLQKIAKRFRAYRPFLLNWYDHPISTGPLEAANNKIKTLQRRAYGFRDRAYFLWQIYAQHEKRYALVG
jgi:transposase